MKKKIILLLSFLLISLPCFSNSLECVIEKIGKRPQGKQIRIIWLVSVIELGNREINHRSSRSYEYIDNTEGDSKYLQILFYPSNVAGNAILSLEKEHKTYLFNKQSNMAMEVEYFPPIVFFDFYIPAEYEVLNESHDEKEKGIQTIRITDGELDYEYTIGKDCVPIMMTITNHFSSELITKTEYSLFTNKFEYGDEFLIPVRFECWYSLHPYDTYIKNPRDTLYADFPDDIFTLEFLENL